MYINNINTPSPFIRMSEDGKFKQIDVSEFGYCGITENNNIMCKDAESKRKLATNDNQKWKYVDSKNGLYGINKNDEIYFTR